MCTGETKEDLEFGSALTSPKYKNPPTLNKKTDFLSLDSKMWASLLADAHNRIGL